MYSKIIRTNVIVLVLLATNAYSESIPPVMYGSYSVCFGDYQVNESAEQLARAGLARQNAIIPEACTRYTCPTGYSSNNGATFGGMIDETHFHIKSRCTGWLYIGTLDKIEFKYFADPKSTRCPSEGNPCSPATGNKTQTETDFSLADGSLKVQRFYSSQGVGDGFKELGPRWRHNYSQRVDGYIYGSELHIERYTPSPLYNTPEEACTQGWDALKGTVYRGLLIESSAVYSNSGCSVVDNEGSVALDLPIRNTFNGQQGDVTLNLVRSLSRANGDIYSFHMLDDHWQPIFSTRTTLTENETGWAFTDTNGTVERYDDGGKLLTATSSAGWKTTFTYNTEGYLATVSGPFGDTLTYHYNENGHLVSITTPEGDLGYSYDEAGRLSRVTYVDGSERHYHYEDPNFPYHLTGITDENNARFATWAYDEEGRAISSEHADGAERVAFTYNSDGTTTVTDAAGAERTYHFIVKRGAMKVDHIDGDRCTTCANGGTKSYTYDSNGFVATKTDWNGNITTYERDAQGRELSRTEASGTPQAKTVATTWDTTLNKPLIVTEPGQVTSYTYDAKGRLQTKQQRAQP
jgi:YD repeat-containing protein